jgi:hypothetical protein
MYSDFCCSQTISCWYHTNAMHDCAHDGVNGECFSFDTAATTCPPAGTIIVVCCLADSNATKHTQSPS